MNNTFLIITMFAIGLIIVLYALDRHGVSELISDIMIPIVVSATIIFIVIGGLAPYWDKTIKYSYDIPIEKCDIGFIAKHNDRVTYNQDYRFVINHSISNVCMEMTTRQAGFGYHETEYEIVEIPKEK